MAHHLGTACSSAFDRILYHLFRCQDACGGKKIRLHDCPGLSCPPVREPDIPAEPECNCRYCCIDDLPCRTIYCDKHCADVAVRASPLDGAPPRGRNCHCLYGYRGPLTGCVANT